MDRRAFFASLAAFIAGRKLKRQQPLSSLRELHQGVKIELSQGVKIVTRFAPGLGFVCDVYYKSEAERKEFVRRHGVFWSRSGNLFGPPIAGHRYIREL